MYMRTKSGKLLGSFCVLSLNDLRVHVYKEGVVVLMEIKEKSYTSRGR